MKPGGVRGTLKLTERGAALAGHTGEALLAREVEDGHSVKLHPLLLPDVCEVTWK